MDSYSLQGRVAVVTGACGLLGKRYVRVLRDSAAHVVVVDLDEVTCLRVAEELREVPGAGRVLGVAADVTRPESVARLREATLVEFGGIDVLVNSAALDEKVESRAGAGELSRFERYPVEHFRRSLDVNVIGTFLPSQMLGAVMAEGGRGSIINVASTYGMVAPDQSVYRRPDGTQPFYKSPAYPAAKGAILSFTRFLASYWGRCGVRVNAISPGGVENGQEEYFVASYGARTPLGRMARPGELEGAVLFLASDASSYVTGSNLVVDGGFTAW